MTLHNNILRFQKAMQSPLRLQHPFVLTKPNTWIDSGYTISILTVIRLRLTMTALLCFPLKLKLNLRKELRN